MEGFFMEDTIVSIVNCIFGWALMTLSLLGYIVTHKNLGQRWFAWVLLAFGWGLFAVAQALLLVEGALPMVVIVSLWLSSYIMVISAIVLLFLKLIHLKNHPEGSI
jgi:hypothetical protein